MIPADKSYRWMPLGDLPPLQGQPLPRGMVAFLYTDIEGSTRLWQEQPERMPGALERHDALIQEAVVGAGGAIFRRMGDAVCAAFPAPGPALAAAVAAQRALHAEPWEEGCVLRVRMGLHTGEAEIRAGDYVGHTLNRVARLLSAGHGGQILLSAATRDTVGSDLPAGTELLDLGEHRLKDLAEPEHIYQLRVPGLPNTFPALVTAGGQVTNLPLQLTPFIGRRREVDEIIELLKDPGVRLLTLTGPGGTGKTRLALEAARARLPHMQDGAFAVLLAPLADHALIPAAIAEALALQQSGQDLIERIVAYLEEKRLILVLDNYEHLLEGAGVVSTLLHRCPLLQVLVTSRIPLHLTGEREYAVPPLSLPDPEYLPDLGRLSQHDALLFFVDRARAVRADFSLTDENAAGVVAICRKLDGLPLAIELAAARIKLFPPAALLLRLEHRLRLLTGGAKDRPARQQTLRGAIDWSYSLLTEEEQVVFARLSVFSGGCTCEAVEAVCNPEGELDLLDGLASLVDKSLLRQVGEEESRFSMLETIREYALEKLEERGEQEVRRDAHAAYFLALAEEAKPLLDRAVSEAWLERFADERDNARLAFRRLLDTGRDEEAARLTVALWGFWRSTWKGSWTEGKRQLEEVVARPTLSAGTRSWALWRLSNYLYHAGAYDRMDAVSHEMITLARQTGDPMIEFHGVMQLWNAACRQGNQAEADALYEACLELAPRTHDPECQTSVIRMQGFHAQQQGNLGRAAELFAQEVALRRNPEVGGDLRGGLLNVGWVAFLQGDLSTAEAAFAENGLFPGLLGLAAVALARGQYDDALRRYAELVPRFLREGFVPRLTESLLGIAQVAGVRGRPALTAALVGATDAARAGLGFPVDQLPEEQERLARARAAMGETAWTAEYERGRRLSLKDVTQVALQFASESGDLAR